MGSTRDTLKRRVRKTVKWGGAGLTVLLVVAWIGSGWWVALSRFDWDYVVNVAGGQVALCRNPAAAADRWADVYFFKSAQFSFTLGFGKDNWVGTSVTVFPLWLPALLTLVATAAAWRADHKYLRRAREGACLACGYDRAGLAASAVCPECGARGGVVKAPA